MSILSGLRLLFTVKAGTGSGPPEKPCQVLESACTQQQDLLRQVRRGLIDVAAARQELRYQVDTLRARLPELEAQTRCDLAAQCGDPAQLTLQRQLTCLAELSGLDGLLGEVAEDELKLTLAEQQFALCLDRLRAGRDTLAARWTTAEAQVEVQQTLRGLSPKAADWSQTLERARTKIEQLQSRTRALDALLKTGAQAIPGQLIYKNPGAGKTLLPMT
jgi:phage shock protein A